MAKLTYEDDDCCHHSSGSGRECPAEVAAVTLGKGSFSVIPEAQSRVLQRFTGVSICPLKNSFPNGNQRHLCSQWPGEHTDRSRKLQRAGFPELLRSSGASAHLASERGLLVLKALGASFAWFPSLSFLVLFTLNDGITSTQGPSS